LGHRYNAARGKRLRGITDCSLRARTVVFVEEKVMPKKKTPASASTPSTKEGKSQSKPIKNNVRKLRRERKWTQWQLAQISRLSQRTIQRIERGARMGITAELALARAFEVEISELYASAPSDKGGETNPDMPKHFLILNRLVSGAALLDVIEVDSLNSNAGAVEGEQRPAVEDFSQHISVWGMMWREVEPGDRGKACLVFQTMLDELDACGVYVFGGRFSEQCPDGTNRQAGRLIFKRADDPQIIQPKLLRQFGKAMCVITVPFSP
jgi:DNA-binding XRE family transcriptional regulator